MCTANYPLLHVHTSDSFIVKSLSTTKQYSQEHRSWMNEVRNPNDHCKNQVKFSHYTTDQWSVHSSVHAVRYVYVILKIGQRTFWRSLVLDFRHSLTAKTCNKIHYPALSHTCSTTSALSLSIFLSLPSNGCNLHFPSLNIISRELQHTMLHIAPLHPTQRRKNANLLANIKSQLRSIWALWLDILGQQW